MSGRENDYGGWIERWAKIRSEKRRAMAGVSDESAIDQLDPREPHALQESGYHGILPDVPCPMGDFLAQEAHWAELEAEANEPPLDPWGVWQQSECGHEHLACWSGRYHYWVDDEVER
jgi:hypothetical protein